MNDTECKSCRFDRLIIFIMIYFNGAVFFQSQYPGIAMLAYLFVCIAYYFSKRNKIRIPSYNIRVASLLILWTILNTYVFHTDAINKSFLDYLLYMIGTCLVISCMDFIVFKECLLKVFSLLTITSIIVNFLSTLYELPSIDIPIAEGVFHMSLYIFNTTHEGRLSSVYWEPGQYQIVIFFIIAFYYNDFKKWVTIKKHLKEFLILLIGLLLTVSTTGYITLAILIVGISISSGVAKRKLMQFPIIILFSSLCIYGLWHSDAVQDKLNMNSVGAYNSYNVRLSDNEGLLKMIMKRPIIGYGIGTASAEKAKSKYFIETQSNGWLRLGAENGGVYLILMFILLYKGLNRKYNSKKDIFFILACMIISQSNEGNAFLPYMFMHVFMFNKNERLIYEK